MIRIAPERQRWNNMREMRKAFNLSTSNDGIEEFLAFWDSLNQAQRVQLRREDLNNIAEWWDGPTPTTANKEK